MTDRVQVISLPISDFEGFCLKTVTFQSPISNVTNYDIKIYQNAWIWTQNVIKMHSIVFTNFI